MCWKQIQFTLSPPQPPPNPLQSLMEEILQGEMCLEIILKKNWSLEGIWKWFRKLFALLKKSFINNFRIESLFYFNFILFIMF